MQSVLATVPLFGIPAKRDRKEFSLEFYSDSLNRESITLARIRSDRIFIRHGLSLGGSVGQQEGVDFCRTERRSFSVLNVRWSVMRMQFHS